MAVGGMTILIISTLNNHKYQTPLNLNISAGRFSGTYESPLLAIQDLDNMVCNGKIWSIISEA